MRNEGALTIGRLARAAQVNIETVRYYQTRKLLPIPRPIGAFRYYPAGLGERIQFIKRAQELGFSLEEIRELLRLNDGVDRASIRKIARARLEQIDVKLRELSRMRAALNGLIEDCQQGAGSAPCPIIKTLARPRRGKEVKTVAA
jgi:MerR family mercuric resistance operon transcriptional regulator